MPSKTIKTMAEKKGISVKKAESKWKQAEKLAEKEGKAENYAYIMGIFKKLIGGYNESFEEFFNNRNVMSNDYLEMFDNDIVKRMKHYDKINGIMYSIPHMMFEKISENNIKSENIDKVFISFFDKYENEFREKSNYPLFRNKDTDDYILEDLKIILNFNDLLLTSFIKKFLKQSLIEQKEFRFKLDEELDNYLSNVNLYSMRHFKKHLKMYMKNNFSYEKYKMLKSGNIGAMSISQNNEKEGMLSLEKKANIGALSFEEFFNNNIKI